MTYRGHVKHGVIVLDPPAALPEGMEVEVRAPETSATHDAPADGEFSENEILAIGSVAAATVSLSKEDFSDWEK